MIHLHALVLGPVLHPQPQLLSAAWAQGPGVRTEAISSSCYVGCTLHPPSPAAAGHSTALAATDRNTRAAILVTSLVITCHNTDVSGPAGVIRLTVCNDTRGIDGQ